jgi:hypothetical protein
MRPRVFITIPQPCSENWAAMLPTATGRHCVASAKTVVDFTQQPDAEILAFLAKATSGRTCCRFVAGQLERPLQRAAPATPMAPRWRVWLAAAVAVWAAREAISETTHAQVVSPQLLVGGLPTEARPLPAPCVVPPAEPLVLRGAVVDEQHIRLPGATVLLKGTSMGASTTADGTFELLIPATQVPLTLTMVVSSVGFVTNEQVLAPGAATAAMQIMLKGDERQISGVIVVPAIAPPAPWHPRRLYYWGKYWVTRPFRRS